MTHTTVRQILFLAVLHAGQRDQVEGDVLEHIRAAHVRAMREAVPTLPETTAATIVREAITQEGRDIRVNTDVFADMLRAHGGRS